MIKKRIQKVLFRMLDAAIRRAMPVVLKNYYAVYAAHWHPHHALRREALDETVAYIKANMSNAMIMNSELDVLSYAGRKVTLDGQFLEFGVRTGKTINHIANEHSGKPVYGFDSFQGLPEQWSGWIQDEGTFARNSLPDVRDNVKLVVGWFEETLPQFVMQHQADIAFLHIDSDIYASARTVLRTLAPLIRPGTIIVFNEYFNYPNWQQHEFKAFREYCDDHGVEYEYLCWGQFEVAIRVTRIANAQTDAKGRENSGQ